jgi:beta-N-acetylhexosaminidase
MREMNQNDLGPYRALRHELPMIMVNHAAYPNTPSGNRPASASRYWITTILRNRIGYRGIVFSDDLEMGGILKFLPIEEAAIAAIRAGMDLLEICHSPELILRAYESLISEAERSVAFRNLLTKRARQTSLKRKKLFSEKASAALSTKQFEILRSRILRFGKTISRAQPTTEV